MAALLCGSTPSGTRTQCTGKDNHDRLMALYHTGTDVKRHLLQYHLSQKNLDLADYLYGRYQFLQPDDIKRALRTKNIQLSDLGIYSIDTLLSDQCFDLFWDSCLDKDKTSLENILNRYKEHLYSLYKTSGSDHNGSARNARKREYLSKKQWECLYKGPEDITENDVQLSLTFPNKGLIIQSFDDDMNFVLLSNVCPLYQSLQLVTTNQIKLSRIAVEHETNNETFDEIWKLMATHLKPISSYCNCDTHFDHKLDWIKKGTFKCIQVQENRKLILESTFDNKTFSEDAEFMTRVQRELNLIETEYTKDLVSKHCDKEIHVVLVHGQYVAGSYPLSIEKATRQDLESCQSVCSRQVFHYNN
ncbi:uncharacterized protein LOC127722238 [Mytilus californianus]|uniref:uncharacterized protein LOC127722238 n=1 Tax=Mytilus californianus TaxID=6549 RepID=UPI002247761C|nr:uncharacterized protein LOC127722238 [Mytilus californianus]